MVKQEPYKGVFEGMDFPAYEYQHYPLLMKTDQGEERIVESEKEEAETVADGFKAPKVGPPANLNQAEVDGLREEARREGS